MFANRGLIDLLQQPVDAIARGFANLAEDAGGVDVAGLQPVEVDDGHPAQPADFNRETDVDDAIHGGREDGDGEPQRAQLEGAVDLLGVNGDSPRHQRHLIKAVGATRPLESTQLQRVGGHHGR